MLGFVTANIVDLSDSEKERYKAFYCGLCHMLKERSGTFARMCLSYDLTFLIMLFGSLYEPVEERRSVPCPAHPLKPRDAILTEHTPYAADMAVTLAYYKCLDDWNDEGKRSARRMNRMLEKPCRSAVERWPRQCEAIETGLERIAEIEGQAFDAEEAGEEPRSDDVGPDEAARLFGAILGSIFVYDEDDIWADALWRLGAKLGRFIYFMDAAVDLDEDIKHDRYNPYRSLDLDAERMRTLLMHLIGETADEFERLPLERDLRTMRSVLYAGVWQQFCAQHGTGDADETTREDDASQAL